MKVLLAEDDDTMRQALRLLLERRGFSVEACSNGRAALDRLHARACDAVVLDLSLPELDGLALLHKARRSGIATPILVHTARAEVGDRIQSLNAGADDFLSKPCDPDELEARLRALVRRHARVQAMAIDCGPLRLDLPSGVFYLHGELLTLTPREHALLRTLVESSGHHAPSDRLSRFVFPTHADVGPGALAVVASRLRKKLHGSGVQLVNRRNGSYGLRPLS